MKNIKEFKKVFQENGLRFTESRRAVASILLKSKKHALSSEEIFTEIQSSNKFTCDQVSVYRSLSVFENLKIVKKTIFQGQASRYKICSSAIGHEHYFKCDLCNNIESLGGCFFSKKEKELEKKGFKNLRHHIEITGLCPKCAVNS